MAFYSPSVVIMTVSLAILEIFSVKEWPDLEIWIWGRRGSTDHVCISIGPPL